MAKKQSTKATPAPSQVAKLDYEALGTASEQIESPEALVTWLLGIVEEWKQNNGDVYCVAIAGQTEAETSEDAAIEAGLFRVIKSQLESDFHPKELAAGIRRLAVIAAKSEAAREVPNG